jgi:DNA invertase Pin-like site-specific DNA recombinase
MNGLENEETDMKKAIPYYRVSTERQGQSGLGLEAQQQAVTLFAKAHRYKLEKAFIEVESGKRQTRPVLLNALMECQDKNATLLIARLDRLTRSVKFIATLMESKVDFKAVDNPYASKLVIHIMAAFAEHERDMISERTKAALQSARARGIKLGKSGKKRAKINKQLPKRFSESLAPLIQRLRKRGYTTVRAITDELNRLQVPTYYTGKWHVGTVHRLLK